MLRSFPDTEITGKDYRRQTDFFSSINASIHENSDSCETSASDDNDDFGFIYMFSDFILNEGNEE